MSRKLWIFLTSISLLMACKKDNENMPGVEPEAAVVQQQTLPLDKVKEWYSNQQNAVNSEYKTQSTSKTFSLSSLSFNWNKAVSFNNSKGNNFWIIHLPGQPIFQGVKQGYRKMVFYLDSTKQIKANILEIIPEARYIQQNKKALTSTFTGHLFVYDQQYKLTGGFIMKNGKPVGNIDPSSNNAKSSLSTKQVMMRQAYIVESCSWQQDSYVNSAGEFTVYAYRICDYYVIDAGDGGGFGGGGGEVGGGGSPEGGYLGGGGGGGGDVGTAPAPAELPGQTKDAVDPKKMTDCFGNITDVNATQSVTIYAQEPWPGTSFNVGPNSVGHVAIGLSKSGGGASVTQVVGYYPTGSGWDAMSSPAKVVDNGGDFEYTVSMTFQVSAAQFSQVLNYVAHPPANYSLWDNNCASFVYNALQAGGVAAPNPTTTVGMSGPGGAGTAMTPAGMGSAIRDAQSKGASSVNTNEGTTPRSKGPCN